MESFANDLNQIQMGFFFFILFLSCVEATRLRAMIDVRIFGSTQTIRKGSLIPDPSGTGRNVQRVSEASISVGGGADQTTRTRLPLVHYDGFTLIFKKKNTFETCLFACARTGGAVKPQGASYSSSWVDRVCLLETRRNLAMKRREKKVIAAGSTLLELAC